jgi:hypothetical protein
VGWWLTGGVELRPGLVEVVEEAADDGERGVGGGGGTAGAEEAEDVVAVGRQGRHAGAVEASGGGGGGELEARGLGGRPARLKRRDGLEAAALCGGGTRNG